MRMLDDPWWLHIEIEDKLIGSTDSFWLDEATPEGQTNKINKDGLRQNYIKECNNQMNVFA